MIVDAAGAGGLAGAASEAGVEVIEEGVRRLDAGIDGGFHEIDASAGGFGFVAGEDVGGAGGEAEAAVDAGTEFVMDLGGDSDGKGMGHGGGNPLGRAGVAKES